MRNFTDFEKSFILEIINTPLEKKNANGEEVFMRCGSTLLRNFFYCIKIEIAPDKKSFSIDFDRKTDRLNYTNFIDSFYLIRYLEDNLYLGIDQIPSEADKLDFIDPKYEKEGDGDKYKVKKIQGVSIPQRLINTLTFNSQLAAEVQRFCSSVYHPTSALIDLAKDFKTPEMRIAEKQINIAWWAIGVALFIGLLSILISICK